MQSTVLHVSSLQRRFAKDTWRRIGFSGSLKTKFKNPVLNNVPMYHILKDFLMLSKQKQVKDVKCICED